MASSAVSAGDAKKSTGEEKDNKRKPGKAVKGSAAAKKQNTGRVWIVLVNHHDDCYKRAGTWTRITGVYTDKQKAMKTAVSTWVDVFIDQDGELDEKDMTTEEKTLRAHPRMVEIFGTLKKIEEGKPEKTVDDVLDDMLEEENQKMYDLMCAWHDTRTGEYTDSPGGESVSIECHNIE